HAVAGGDGKHLGDGAAALQRLGRLDLVGGTLPGHGSAHRDAGDGAQFAAVVLGVELGAELALGLGGVLRFDVHALGAVHAAAAAVGRLGVGEVDAELLLRVAHGLGSLGNRAAGQDRGVGALQVGGELVSGQGRHGSLAGLGWLGYQVK